MTAETPFAEIVDISLSEVYLVNENTLCFEYANAAATSNLGYTANELKSLRLTDMFSFPDEMALRALLNSLQRPAHEKLNLKLKFTRKTGSNYDADVQIQRLEKQPGFVIVVTDAT